MGFGLGKFKLKIGNPFTKKGLGTIAIAGIGGPGMGLLSLNEEGRSLETSIAKGLGNMATGGSLAQAEATKEAKKARDMAQQQYADATAAAEAEAARLANLEEERKKRLMLYGTQQPETLMGSYLGVTGQATVGRATLG